LNASRIRAPKKIIFVGSHPQLLKIFSAENETQVISSISFLQNLTMRFVPDLIVFADFPDADIFEIRRNEKLAFVPILIAAENFRELNNLNSVSNFSNVLICNSSVAASEKFCGRLNDILCRRKKILPSRTGALVKYSLLFINKNFSKKISRSLIARQIGIDDDYLSRIFHFEMGMTLFEYLNFFRLEESRRLLIFTNLKICEIAAECGFSSSAYFINSFRKKFGVSPNVLRNSP
jgi:AraC-like DNA-binding protein